MVIFSWIFVNSNLVKSFSSMGVGIGLRLPHYTHILAEKPPVDWFEIISENFLVDGGRPRDVLDRILDQYQVVMHGVSLYFGSPDKSDREHLKRLKKLVRHTATPWVSDHLCWGSVDGTYTHDLLPMPYTLASAKAAARKIQMVRDILEVPIVVENLSSYVEFVSSTMTEWEFLCEVLDRADCYMLLDVNNVYVSSENHGFDPRVYIDSLPVDRIAQLHIAGHSRYENYIIDTHDRAPCTDVWALFEHTISRTGLIPVLLEWDAHIPSFEEVFNESQKAKRRLDALGSNSWSIKAGSVCSGTREGTEQARPALSSAQFC
jgi:hypothetical protein